MDTVFSLTADNCPLSTASPGLPINASTVPTFAGAPSSATIFNTVPDVGAGISVSTLSVFTSRSGSNSFTESPSFFNHLITVTSSTPSPSKGTKTLVAINAPCSRMSLRGLRRDSVEIPKQSQVTSKQKLGGELRLPRRPRYARNGGSQ